MSQGKFILEDVVEGCNNSSGRGCHDLSLEHLWLSLLDHLDSLCLDLDKWIWTRVLLYGGKKCRNWSWSSAHKD